MIIIMAMMDNAAFLINHIRNSFITSDDTGMCEVILEAEQKPDLWCVSIGESCQTNDEIGIDAELPHSYDILADMAFDSHRRRSNTAQRLEKLKREKQKQSKIKHVPWKTVNHSVDEMGEFFEKKEVPKSDVTKKKSLLSVQLQQVSTVSDNPFINYAKYDGRSGSGVPTKKIQIFLTMAPEEDRSYPMMVVTLATAKVQDLIGLICWQYYTENRSPLLTRHIEAFSLHIAEDDGEVDMDFPALDNKEPISKFGFYKLALVQKLLSETPPKFGVMVNIDMQHRGIYQIPLEAETILMKDLLDQVLIKHGLHQRPGLEYKLEKQCEPGKAIDTSLQLDAMGTYDFFLIRENSARRRSEGDISPSSVSEMAKSLSSMHYQSFVVNMVHKLRTNKEVQIGISGDKIEIDPLSTKGLFKSKPKPVTIDIEDIAACLLTESKHQGKCTFRLVHQVNHEFKHHDFECETSMGREIVQKVNNIIEMRSSPVRKDYKTLKEKKQQKKIILGL
ncbi:hypothetical protein LSH36_156g07027 [Paralvinella palmiformis]|uniref:Target of rapamycin complex 2 subunit MAPKAP1 n=1 Tax=Paralvinella palmiformis TaxID=53620 RepID=A0AAD9N9N4_9ANNE|nr:hypothetical protein LSH36_156g07027 [Paralvinella palmiformis]